MWLVVLSVIALLVLTTLMHYEVLVGLSRVLPALQMTPRFKLVMVILGSFVSHMLQMVLFACAYYVLSHALQTPLASRTAEWSWTTCLYFSAETFTSLGFGDIVPTGALRLLAGAECLNGLLLIGWSASYTYISMERYWKHGAPGAGVPPPPAKRVRRPLRSGRALADAPPRGPSSR